MVEVWMDRVAAFMAPRDGWQEALRVGLVAFSWAPLVLGFTAVMLVVKEVI